MMKQMTEEMTHNCNILTGVLFSGSVTNDDAPHLILGHFYQHGVFMP
jgi:hypothetical protein